MFGDFALGQIGSLGPSGAAKGLALHVNRLCAKQLAWLVISSFLYCLH